MSLSRRGQVDFARRLDGRGSTRTRIGLERAGCAPLPRQPPARKFESKQTKRYADTLRAALALADRGAHSSLPRRSSHRDHERCRRRSVACRAPGRGGALRHVDDAAVHRPRRVQLPRRGRTRREPHIRGTRSEGWGARWGARRVASRPPHPPERPETPAKTGVSSYRGGRTRTCNPRFWRPVRYQLRHAPGLRHECSRSSERLPAAAK